MDPEDGISVWCAAPTGKDEGQCPAQEVAGHGKNEKEAYEIILQKYKKSS